MKDDYSYPSTSAAQTLTAQYREDWLRYDSSLVFKSNLTLTTIIIVVVVIMIIKMHLC